MTDTQEKAVKNLNELVNICNDGYKGYQDAADNVDNDQLKSTFSKFAQQRKDYAETLKSEIRRMGGDPNKGGDAKGAAHRTWLDIKSALSGGKPETVLKEVETGESTAVKEYEEALREDLPDYVQNTLREQHTGIVNARQEIQSLKQQFK